MTISDVYRLFGEAAHWSSILEEQLWNICVLNERVINHAKHGNGNEKIFKKFERMEIGRLIGELKKALGKEFDGKVDTIFKPALEKRNRLIHGFFVDHHEILTNWERIPIAIAELTEIKNTIFPAADFATKTCTALVGLYTTGNSDAQPCGQPDPAHKAAQGRLP
ncbi:hypothetical protein [Dechloromonas sp. CZR5]|uniref:hypothetical protein n=1 Tax=Dechloromonas sp. CZR5 TaxID=2608630 RepID=UPI00123C967A|nr:hypothetical protein [Dechloromonas sp. CZR5]